MSRTAILGRLYVVTGCYGCGARLLPGVTGLCGDCLDRLDDVRTATPPWSPYPPAFGQDRDYYDRPA